MGTCGRIASFFGTACNLSPMSALMVALDESTDERQVVMISDVFVDPLPCPKCKAAEIRVLPFSEDIRVWHWFLRCVACGHEWTIPKHAQDAPPACGVHA
jgi:rRNA maturation endonuclease Nob1